jgi:hypothetical protein
MVIFPYNTTDFSFTLEDVFIQFSTENVNTYFDLKIIITYFEFFSSEEKSKILEYKIPLFNNQQSENVGRKIHRYLANSPVYASEFGFQYKTAKVTFLATEINIGDKTTASTTLLADVKFIAGPEPSLLSNNNALLSANTNYERVTENGLFIVNLLLSEGNHTLKVLKNNIEVQTEDITATATDNVFSKKIVVKDFSGAKGDVFEVLLENTTIKKTFVVFPNNVHSKQLVFVDKNKLFRSLECTGHFSFPNKYDQITHNYKRNLVEVLEIIETEKVNNLKLNTGWVLKTDTETTDALLSSKKTYLVENNISTLEMVPLAKKQTEEDSDEELYAYDLEFQINKKNA